jgi:hypothetical protein
MACCTKTGPLLHAPDWDLDNVSVHDRKSGHHADQDPKPLKKDDRDTHSGMREHIHTIGRELVVFP